MLKEELNKRGADIPFDARQLKLLNMMIHALILKRQKPGCIVQFRSSGDISVDPLSTWAMSVDPPMYYLGYLNSVA